MKDTKSVMLLDTSINRMEIGKLFNLSYWGRLIAFSSLAALALMTGCGSSNVEPLPADEVVNDSPSVPVVSPAPPTVVPPIDTEPSDDAPAMPSSSLLNKDNQIAITGYVFSVFRGTPYDERLTLIPTLFTEQAPDTESFEFLSSPSFEALQTIREYSCDNSGKASSNTLGPSSDIIEQMIINFLDCEWRSSRYDGEMTIDYSRASPAFSFEKYSIEESSGSTYEATGTLRSGGLCEEDDYLVVISNLDKFEHQEGTSVTTINGAMTRFGYGNQCLNGEVAVLEGSFTVRSNETGSNLLNVTTPISFKNSISSDRNFPVGSMLIRAADDSVISVNADNGDLNTVTLTLTVAGVSEVFIVNWDNWQNSLTF